MKRPLRPQLTPMVMFYAVFDILGMLIFATGGTWLANGKTLFLENFPRNNFEAALLTIAGIALMLWAAAQILRELLKRAPGEEEQP